MPATIDFIVSGGITLPILWSDGTEARVEKLTPGMTDVTLRPVVKNNTVAPVTVTGVKIAGSGIVSGAEIVNTVPFTLQPGEQKEVPIKFSFTGVVAGAAGRAVLNPEANV